MADSVAMGASPDMASYMASVALPNGFLGGGEIVESLLLFLPLIPFIGSLIVFLSGSVLNGSHNNMAGGHAHHESSSKMPGVFASLISFISFLVAVVLFLRLESGNTLVASAWNWISAGDLDVALQFRLDNLSAMMCLIITGIGTLIHVYAIGYMGHDEHPARFFSYLNLFLGSMLILVLGDNLVLMFVGWEGVGLCSYLLIGFWFKEMPNAVAGQKAFVVNRIGDAGFLLGMFTLFIYGGTLAIPELMSRVGGIPPYALEVAAILLLIGAAGKSAQIPLYVWLPDAMAGPTPVSALIHAATMVTSGVYMVTRLSALFSQTPIALLVISVVGALTAFFAATIALVQFDIKKVLAYSTVSQLGFMFMALGAGAFSVGMYHVLTHAFFKALLFMAAGSVIVGCHHEQDMRKFGGLLKLMTGTGLTYLAGTYAIAGLPYGSGFFSKDSVLWSVYSNPGRPSQIVIFNLWTLSQCLWFLGVLTAALTAFYMTRSFVMTFLGSYRGETSHGKPHESPYTMVIPLVILAVPSLLFGVLYGDALMQFLKPWTRTDFLLGHAALLQNHTYHSLEIVSMIVALASALIAGILYIYMPGIPLKLSRSLSPVYSFLQNKWYIDELYNLLIVIPLRAFSKILFYLVDRIIIDGLFVNGSAALIDTTGMTFRALHGGKISSAVIVMFSCFVFFFIFWMVL
ncbi:MAG TPA: NADH-quinone oxidoreductase subunit L [Oligoflexia bacterium]|nr:NADH-quinone oxidoreductase subunit L [Oligoflexia bacterium]HMP47894.1 NADH-quinone oxidoreductase subunit L [Oligoflexia bacterium]